jgi:hypothetical protein
MNNGQRDTPQSSSEIILYQTEDVRNRIEVRLENETVWLTQQHMAELFQTTQQNVSLHIRNVYEEGELHSEATHEEFLCPGSKMEVLCRDILAADKPLYTFDHPANAAILDAGAKRIDMLPLSDFRGAARERDR